MSKGDKSTNFMAGVIIGVFSGIVAGLLLAPKKGEETIQDIKVFACNVKEKFGPEIEKTKGKARELLERAKCKLEAQYNKIKENQEAKKLADAKNKEHDIYCL